MGLTEDQVDGIRMAGVIHDLGKISVPAEILSKPGKLSALEFSLIKTHPQTGYDILKGIDFQWPIAQIVLQHHERLDGSGYPQGLIGDEIMDEAKILAVSDVVEAMSSHRPYRATLGIDAALEEVTKNKGTLYDAAVVDTTVNLFTKKDFQF
jgi:HD-GYP domain-containing protein (c-di-GMP phosphodiesterase class II)